MKDIKIVSRWDSNKVLLCGKYESIKECLEKNRGTDLRDADLRGANLGGAYLGCAYLRGAKNYYDSHDFAQEIIRRQEIKYFTNKEWFFIGKLLTHRFRWKQIRKYKIAKNVCKKIAKAGFNEFLKKFKEIGGMI